MPKMKKQEKIKIGFVTPVSANSRHFAPFQALIPEHVEMELEELNIVGETLESLRGAGQMVADKSAELAKERGWQGVIVSGAPVEVLNPGLLELLKEKIEVPVTTALDSCVHALKAFHVQKVLLLTPFVESMNVLIRDYLHAHNFKSYSPSKTFNDYKDAIVVEPGAVYDLAQNAFNNQDDVDALYFQGAVLDPLKILEKLEMDILKPIVASNPGMLWYILSLLGIQCRIPGCGQLLRQWPPIR